MAIRARAPPAGPTRPLAPAVDPRPTSRLPEPPAFRTHPAGAPGACVNCAAPVAPRATTPLCWGCGRPLCTDCYWRHGLDPTAHRCASCQRHASSSSSSLSISGARSGAPGGFKATR